MRPELRAESTDKTESQHSDKQHLWFWRTQRCIVDQTISVIRSIFRPFAKPVNNGLALSKDSICDLEIHSLLLVARYHSLQREWSQ